MKKPGVLIICPFFSPNIGGVERHLDILTEYLIKNNYTVSVLTYRPLVAKIDNYLKYERKGKLKIHRFWWFPGWFDKTTPYPILQFFYIVPGLLICSLLWMIKNHQRVDVIHAHGFAAAFIARVIGLFWQDKRKVFSTHFIYKRLNSRGLYGRLFKWVARGFNKVLLIGKESGKELMAAGLDEKKMKIFHHWLDQKRFIPQVKKQCRRKLKLPENAKIVGLFIGRMVKMKGIFVLLESIKKLPKNVVFVLVGDGSDRIELGKASENVNNFLLVGRKTPEEIIDYLGAADFLILPSLAEEAQPMAIIESLSCGRPVVVTDKGAAKEMFDASVGLVIGPTIKNIYNTVMSFYKDSTILAKLTTNARPFAEKHFSEKNAKIITESYYD